MNLPLPKKILLNHSHQLNLSLLVLGLAILPFLAVSFYCHPFADDFWLTNIAIEKGSWQAQQLIRQTWSGRYFAMFLGSINPLVYHSIAGYKTLPLVLMLLNLLALYYFITNYTAGISAKYRLLAALCLEVIYLGFMPAISSGFYWMSSALNYQTALILMLLLAALLRSYRKNRRAGSQTGYILLVSILLFAAVGCNELGMILLLEATILLFVLDFRQHGRFNGMLLWFILVALTGTLLVIFSPGNVARWQTHENHSNLLYSLVYAFMVSVNNTFNYLTSAPVLLATILFIPLSQYLFRQLTITRLPHPVITSAALFLVIFQCFFIVYYNRGTHAPIWTQNFIYFVFLCGWFINIGCCTLYYQKIKNRPVSKLPAYANILLISALLLLIFHHKQSNVRIAYTDWLSGEAARYNQELNRRYQQLQSSNCQECPVKALQHRPPTIFFREVPASNDWENTYYARYFGKKLLIVTE